MLGEFIVFQVQLLLSDFLIVGNISYYKASRCRFSCLAGFATLLYANIY